jgi:hypothetical protein
LSICAGQEGDERPENQKGVWRGRRAVFVEEFMLCVYVIC